MYRSTSSRHHSSHQEWNVTNSGGQSRLPKFVQARSAQHRLKKIINPKPTAIVQPVAVPLLPQVVDFSKSFKQYEWGETTSSTKLYNISENEDVPENIVWNQKTVDLVVDDTFKTRISQLEYQINQMDNQLRRQETSLKSTRDELSRALNLADGLDREKKLAEESAKKAKEAHFETDLRLCSVTKLQTKYEKLYEETKTNLEVESMAKSAFEREAKRFESELKISNETVQFAENLVREVQSKLSAKQQEVLSLVTTLEEHQRLIAKLQQETKILQERVIVLEKEVTTERINKEAYQKSEAELHNELQTVLVKFQEILNKNSAQTDIIADRERDIQKTKRELSDLVAEHENTLTVLKSKFGDQILNLNEQLSNLQRQKLSVDKAIIEAKRKNEELTTELESSYRVKRRIEISRQRIDDKAFERHLRIEQQHGFISDLTGQKFKLSADNDKLRSTVYKAESDTKDALTKLQASNRQINVLEFDLDRNLNENRDLKQQVNILTSQNTTLDNKLVETNQEADNYARKLANANEDKQYLMNRCHEIELAKIQELEEQKLKYEVKLHNLNEEKETLNNKISSLDKVRLHLLTDIQDLQDSLELANNKIHLAEQKIKYYEKYTEEQDKKLQETLENLHLTEEENRSLMRFAERLQASLVEAEESVQKLSSENDLLRSDLRTLDAELAKVSEQAKEAERQLRRLNEENVYNLKQLDQAEIVVLERDEKISRLKIEIANFNAILEQKIEEKRLEFEMIRKDLTQKILELTINLESETSSRLEVLKRQKIIEIQLTETENLLQHARKYTEEAQALARKFQDHNRILTQNLMQSGERCREYEKEIQCADMHMKKMQIQCEEMSHTIQNLDAENLHLKTKVETIRRELLEKQDRVDFLTNEKRRVETEFLDLQSEFNSLNDRFAEQGERLSHFEAANHNLSECLANEASQLSAAKAVNLRLETKIFDLENALERAERNTAIVVEKALSTVQVELLQAQSDLIKEKEVHLETTKREQHVRKQYQEATFQYEEEKKRCEKMDELIQIMESKVVIYNRQRQEAETESVSEHMRCKALDTELLYTNERASVAESVLNRVRTESKMHALGSVDVSYNRSLYTYID